MYKSTARMGEVEMSKRTLYIQLPSLLRLDLSAIVNKNEIYFYYKSTCLVVLNFL